MQVTIMTNDDAIFSKDISSSKTIYVIITMFFLIPSQTTQCIKRESYMPDVENVEEPDLERIDPEMEEIGVDEGSNEKENKSDHHIETNENDTGRRKIIRGFKWAGIVLFPLVAVATFFGFNRPLPQNISDQSKEVGTSEATIKQETAEKEKRVDRINLTLTKTEQVWKKIFMEKHGVYKKPKLTQFSGKIESVCGLKQAASGSFYCPQEQRIYIDLSLYVDLTNRLDIPGDFAQAYIIAHEVGHHIQNLAGISEQIPEARLKLNDKAFKKVSLRLELQADCFAGIWAKHTDNQFNNITQEDIVDTLNAVNRISRERLRAQTENEITPDPLTHGSARQRIHWFMTGYSMGDFDACDTFTTTDL
jgi:hypothetical protein